MGIEGSTASVVIIALCLISTATPGAAQKRDKKNANVYDEFRAVEYSNKGLLSEEQEKELAAEVHKQVLQKERLLEDPQVSNYVASVGRRLVPASRRPNLEYRFYVIDSKTVNAFTTGGGYVYIYTGLLRRLEDESELAGVLGHEVGHVVARHVPKNFKRAQRYGLLLGLSEAILGRGGAGGGLANLAIQLFASGILLKHGREAEREADFLGLYNIADAGYDIEGMARLFSNVLGPLGKNNPGAMDKIFSSHPPAVERLVNTRREIDEHLSPRRRNGVSRTPGFDAMLRRLGGPIRD